MYKKFISLILFVTLLYTDTKTCLAKADHSKCNSFNKHFTQTHIPSSYDDEPIPEEYLTQQEIQQRLNSIDEEIRKLVEKRQKLRANLKKDILTDSLAEVQRRWRGTFAYLKKQTNGLQRSERKDELFGKIGKLQDWGDEWGRILKSSISDVQESNALIGLKKKVKRVGGQTVEQLNAMLSQNDNILKLKDVKLFKIQGALNKALRNILPEEKKKRRLLRRLKKASRKAGKKARRFGKRVDYKSRFIYRGYLKPLGAFAWRRARLAVKSAPARFYHIRSRAIQTKNDVAASQKWQEAQKAARTFCDQSQNVTTSFVVSTVDLSRRGSREIIMQAQNAARYLNLHLLGAHHRLIALLQTAFYRVKIFLIALLTLLGLWALNRLATFMTVTYAMSQGVFDFVKRIIGFSNVPSRFHEVQRVPEKHMNTMSGYESFSAPTLVAQHGNEAVVSIPVAGRSRNSNIKIRVMYEEPPKAEDGILDDQFHEEPNPPSPFACGARTRKESSRKTSTAHRRKSLSRYRYKPKAATGSSSAKKTPKDIVIIDD